MPRKPALRKSAARPGSIKKAVAKTTAAKPIGKPVSKASPKAAKGAKAAKPFWLPAAKDDDD
jgi:hypothetical protein